MEMDPFSFTTAISVIFSGLTILGRDINRNPRAVQGFQKLFQPLLRDRMAEKVIEFIDNVSNEEAPLLPS